MLLIQKPVLIGLFMTLAATSIHCGEDPEGKEESEATLNTESNSTNEDTVDSESTNSSSSDMEPSAEDSDLDGDDDDDNDASDLSSDDVFSEISFSFHPKVNTLIVAEWMQKAPADSVWIEFNFEGDEWLKSPKTSRAVGEHKEVLLGVPESLDVDVKIVATIDGKTIESKISSTSNGEPPSRMVKPTVQSYEASLASDNRWMLGAVSEKGAGGYGGPHWIYIIDRKGRVVWYYRPTGGSNGNLNQSFWPRISRDGTHITLDQQRRSSHGEILFTTLDFGYEKTISTPGIGDCYDVTTDGSIIYEDRSKVLEITAEGTRRTLWRCDFGDRNCYSNSVNWDPASDTVLVSYPYANTVARIDRENASLKSKWGEKGDWKFEPSNLGLGFNHWASISIDGTFMVSSHTPRKGSKGTRPHLFMEYTIDEASKTLKSIWIFGEGTNDWAEERGMTSRIEGGNTIGNYGPSGVILEITPEKEIAWRVVFANKLLGNNILLNDLYALNRGPS